jgi:hypothetical protein
VTREGVESKAQRYLCERRLIVEHVDAELVRATCRGDLGMVYDTGWTPTYGWSCNCPARRRCAHVIALQAVTVREGPAAT